MDRRLDEEVQFHIDMQTEKNARLGMSPQEARRAASIQFGAIERFKEEARDEYRSRPLDELIQDLRFTARVLPRNRGYTAAVILTMTVGLGALSTVFSVVNTVLLQPLPFSRSERVVQIWTGKRGENVHGPISSANFLDLRATSRSFDAIAAEDFAWFNLAGDAGMPPERLMGNLVTAGFFQAVGVRATLGNTFSTDNDGARVVVLSDGVWRRRFNADRSVVGRSILLNGERYVVTGVMPAGFDFPGPLIGQRIDLWTALVWAPGQVQRGIRELGVTARLKAGVSLAQAQQDLDAVAHRLTSDHPTENADLAIRAVPLLDEIVGSSRTVLRVLLGAVTMVLLIACSNVANLTLARGSVRERELRVRAALGASRSRLARQLLTESVVLAIVGGGLGLLGAFWLTQALVAIGPDGLPRLNEIGTDWGVVVFTLLASVVSGLLFGAVPAATSRGPLRSALGERAMTEGHERRRLGSGIVVAQVALSFVLLVGAGLLLRSFVRLTNENPGFDPAGVLVARVSLDAQRYRNDARRIAYVNDAADRLAAIPGVSAAAAVDYLPFGLGDSYLDISVEGRAATEPNEEVAAHLRGIAGGYFAAMRIGVIAGRSFSRDESASGAHVAIVNRAMARRYWPNIPLPDLMGRRVRVGSGPTAGPWLTVVGVVGDVKHWNLGEQYGPELYMPLAQWPASTLHFVARTSAPSGVTAETLRSALLGVDASQPVTIDRMTSLVSASVSQPRFRALLFGFFAALAVTLAVIGVYGVTAYRVAQRRREIGVRLALGARRASILRAVIGQGAVLAGIGVVLGLLGAFWLTRYLQGMLYRVSETDAVTFAGVAAFLGVTALLACLLPARRAARVDPIVAMRSE